MSLCRAVSIGFVCLVHFNRDAYACIWLLVYFSDSIIHTIEQLQVLYIYTCDYTLNNIKLIPTYKLIAAAFMAIRKFYLYVWHGNSLPDQCQIASSTPDIYVCIYIYVYIYIYIFFFFF